MVIFVVVTKLRDQGNFRRKSLFGLLVPEGEHPPQWKSLVISSRHNSKSRNLRAHVYKPNHEIEKANRK